MGQWRVVYVRGLAREPLGLKGLIAAAEEGQVEQQTNHEAHLRVRVRGWTGGGGEGEGRGGGGGGRG